MKNFDFNRFGKAVRWTALANKRHFIRFTLVMTVVYLLVQMQPLLSNLFVTAPSELEIITAMGICQSLFGLSCLYCLTHMFQNLKTKQERIQFFTLPVSMPEKYVSRLLYCGIAMPLASYLALLASTAVRLLLQFVLRHAGIYVGLVSPTLPFSQAFSSDMPVVALLLILSVNVWGVSLFILSGTFFRKQPLVMTFASIFAFFILFGWFFFRYIFDELVPFFVHWTVPETSLFTSSLFLAFAALNFRWSYRMFKRMQVVQNKWFNV